MHEQLEHLYQGQSLSQAQCEEIFQAIMQGEVSDIMLSALLVALKMKGEAAEEIAGAAKAVRDHARAFDTGDKRVVDSCGTGGDGLSTINISTAVAFVAAACGVPMVKHGNRSVSSRSGSADVLEALGVKIEHPVALAEKCLQELDICFLFAPFYHQGIRHAMPVRTALKTRTLFNLLGPLVNPAKPRIQLMGIYEPKLCDAIARTLQLLGVEEAMVVHGSGLDEIALHGSTQVSALSQGKVERYTLTPESFGLEALPLSEIVGGTAEENAAAIKAVLAGEGIDAHRDIIAMNTAALVKLYGLAPDWCAAMEQVTQVLASGQALAKLEALAEMTHECA